METSCMMRRNPELAKGYSGTLVFRNIKSPMTMIREAKSQHYGFDY